MTKRSIAAMMLAALLLTATACNQASDSTDATPSAEATDRQEKPDNSEGSFPDEPKVEIDWENTVVDVEPTSRFRETPGGPDIAHFHTTLALEEQPDGDTQEFFKNLEDVDVEFDDNLVRMTYDREVEEISENRYKFEFDVPVSFAELDKNDDVSAIVLLPRDAEEYENVPGYRVEIDDEFEEIAPENVEVTDADEAPGNRITIGLYERTDPKLPPIWDYIPLYG